MLQQCIVLLIVGKKYKRKTLFDYYEDDILKMLILLCMFLHIRSPESYNFMKNNNLFTLPCIHTIRRHLALLDVNCGFNKQFFDLFKKHLSNKNDLQNHGIILFDEISLLYVLKH